MKDEIKRAGVPVIVHPTMFRANGETENLSFETAASCARPGSPSRCRAGSKATCPRRACCSSRPPSRRRTAWGSRARWPPSTIDAARILGLDARVGSLEAGKDGDLALYDGDPFEYTTHCVGVVIDGDVVHEGPDS